jgi:hypothetical protein
MGKGPRVDRTEVTAHAERNQLGKFDEGPPRGLERFYIPIPVVLPLFGPKLDAFREWLAEKKISKRGWGPIRPRRELLLRLRNSD